MSESSRSIEAGRGRAPALFRARPELAGRVPWMPLGELPTPVQRLELDVPELDGELWVKRDDLSGTPYGGNKVRKLEFLLADAREQGAERLITGGAVGSHHALATTTYGTRSGFDVSLVLFPQSMTEHVREILLLDNALGADMRLCPRMVLFPLYVKLEALARRDQQCYEVVPGGSSPLGTLGYVSAGLEYAAQIEAGHAPVPAAIYLPAGTLGTLSGLAIGLAMAGVRTRLVGMRIVPTVVANQRVLSRLVGETLTLLEDRGAAVPEAAAVLDTVELRGDQFGRGYGYATEAGGEAHARFADAGLTLDPTYTAKAAAGMLESLRGADGVHLFWHTLSARVPEDALREAKDEDLPPEFRALVEKI